MDRRSMIAGGVTLAAALGVSQVASAESKPALDSELDPSRIPAFAGGQLTGVVSETIDVESDGQYSVEADLTTGEFTIARPDGTTVVEHGGTIVSRIAELLAEGPDGEPKEGPAVRSLGTGKQDEIVLRDLKSDVCPYLVGAIGGGHAAAWRAALALVPVNPAVGVIVGLGYGAFWIWVSTNCPS